MPTAMLLQTDGPGRRAARAARMALATPFALVAIVLSAAHVFVGTIALWLTPPRLRARVAGSFTVAAYLVTGPIDTDEELEGVREV